MPIILSCVGALLIIAFASLLVISGIFVQPKYLEPWQKTYSQKFDDPRIRLVAHGLLAANGHNMQPWKIRLDKNNPMVFYLYADSERLTNEVDPPARQMMNLQSDPLYNFLFLPDTNRAAYLPTKLAPEQIQLKKIRQPTQ